MNTNNISGRYQDIEIDGILLKEGQRECNDRWKIIKPHIKENSSIIDIGSYHGYFGVKIRREIENSVVLSIEANRRWAEEQKQIVKANKLTGIAVANHLFSLNDLKWLDTVVEGIDYVLMLSSLEYFPDIENLIKYISKISPSFIVEFPDITETKAAGQEAIKKYYPLDSYLKKYFEDVTVIGESIATTDSNLKRKIYLAKNSSLKRINLYSNKDNIKSRLHTLVFENNTWIITEGLKNKQKYEWIPGFTLYNLLKFNIIYPQKDWFLENARSEYLEVFKQHKSISDISLKNILFTSNKLEVIDYDEAKSIRTIDKFEENFKKFVIDHIK